MTTLPALTIDSDSGRVRGRYWGCRSGCALSQGHERIIETYETLLPLTVDYWSGRHGIAGLCAELDVGCPPHRDGWCWRQREHRIANDRVAGRRSHDDRRPACLVPNTPGPRCLQSEFRQF